MRIVCPACAAAYEVPDAMLSPGRVVRCARCGHEWHPSAPPASPPPTLPLAAADQEGDYRPRPAPLAAEARLGTPNAPPAPIAVPRDSGRRLAMALWVLTGLILLAAAVAAFRWRGAVETAWPPARRVYGWLGLG